MLVAALGLLQLLGLHASLSCTLSRSQPHRQPRARMPHAQGAQRRLARAHVAHATHEPRAGDCRSVRRPDHGTRDARGQGGGGPSCGAGRATSAALAVPLALRVRPAEALVSLVLRVRQSASKSSRSDDAGRLSSSLLPSDALHSSPLQLRPDMPDARAPSLPSRPLLDRPANPSSKEIMQASNPATRVTRQKRRQASRYMG